MLVQHKHKDNKGLFFIQGEEEDALAEIVYLVQGDHTLIIEHTEVSDELRGQNVGFQLVSAVVEYARQHGMKVIPMCLFAKSVIDKKPDFQDVVDNN